MGEWTNWNGNPPRPGDFVYVRDMDAPSIWEIGWCVGKADNVASGVTLPNDPSLSIVKYDEWQLIPAPAY